MLLIAKYTGAKPCNFYYLLFGNWQLHTPAESAVQQYALTHESVWHSVARRGAEEQLAPLNMGISTSVANDPVHRKDDALDATQRDPPQPLIMPHSDDQGCHDGSVRYLFLPLSPHSSFCSADSGLCLLGFGFPPGNDQFVHSYIWLNVDGCNSAFPFGEVMFNAKISQGAECSSSIALPDELLQHILLLSSPHEVARLACVSSRMRYVCTADAIWRHFFALHFMPPVGVPAAAAVKAGSWHKVRYAISSLLH